MVINNNRLVLSLYNNDKLISIENCTFYISKTNLIFDCFHIFCKRVSLHPLVLLQQALLLLLLFILYLLLCLLIKIAN